MLRNILPCLLAFGLLLASCKKGSTDDSPNQSDSLGTGWSKVDIGKGNYFVDIFFSGKTGYGVGGNKILKSPDGGTTWKTVCHVEPILMNIAMWGTSSALFVGGNKIYSTNNGGESFDSTAVTDATIYDVFFINESTAYAIGNRLWKTTDGGQIWRATQDFGESSGKYRSLYFVDTLNGWVNASRNLFKTTDGSMTWEKNTASELSNGMIRAVFFSDTSIGYISNENNILKTNDGGDSWKVVFAKDEFICDIHFLSKDVGYINTLKCIYKTIDGGTNWTKEVKLGGKEQNGQFVELHFIDENHGWSCGHFDYILKYTK